MEKKSLWKFGTREVVFAAIGAALYGVLSWATNLLQIPGAANVSVRPAVAIPIFFGLAFGPWVGMISGGVGNIIGDLLSGYGFWWNWDVGNAILGFIPGLFHPMMTTYKATGDLIKGEIAVILGALGGMFFAGVTDMFVSGYTFAVAMTTAFLPAFITDVVNGLIITPILMVAYSFVIHRSGR